MEVYIMNQEKRKRGGQPGNQNARKHGFYSRALKKDERRYLRQIESADDLDPEVEQLSSKLLEIIRSTPDDSVLINRTAVSLIELIKCRNRLKNLHLSLCIRSLAAGAGKLSTSSSGPSAQGPRTQD
jgi:hypothetical protein